MSQQNREEEDFFNTGRELRKHSSSYQRGEIPPGVAQGLIGDYLAQYEGIQEALKSIVAKPGFLQLLRKEELGVKGVQKSSFVESLSKTYSPEVIQAASILIDGILNYDQDSMADSAISGYVQPALASNAPAKNSLGYLQVSILGIFMLGIRVGEVGRTENPLYLAYWVAAILMAGQFSNWLSAYYVGNRNYSESKRAMHLAALFGTVLLSLFF